MRLYLLGIYKAETNFYSEPKNTDVYWHISARLLLHSCSFFVGWTYAKLL